jgi:hypothetical protein
MAAIGTGGSTLPFGPGSALFEYWTTGPGYAKYATSPHPYTTLHRLLIEAGVPRRFVDGLTTNLLQAVGLR